MSLRVAVRDQREFLAALRMQAARFSGEVEVVSLSIEECEKVAIGEVNGFDLVLMSTDWVPAAVARGSLMCLDGFLVNDPPEDWPDGWHPAMHKLTGVGGAVYGLPYHDGPQVLHYRADIFESPVVRERFFEEIGRELTPPDTWKEFEEVAAMLTDKEAGVWGCCFGGFADGHNNVYDFLVHLWSRGGELFDEDEGPVFDSEEGVAALEFYAGLVGKGCASAECLGMNSVQSGDFYARGSAAMMWNWSGYGTTTENPEVSKIVGLNRTALIPQGSGAKGRRVSINAYWVMAVLATSTQADEAYQFLKFLGSREMDFRATMEGVSGTRLSTWESAEIQAKFPVFLLLAEVHDGSRCLPQRAEFVEVNAILSGAVDDVLNGRWSAREALSLAANEVRKLTC